MLINLSNHPSSKWDETQLYEANRQFGTVDDVPFPNIPPDWDTEEVKTLAHEYFEKIKFTEKEKGEKPVIHITGELVFCFILIQMLLKGGYDCITSTTERIVTEVNNVKTTVFKFKRFRNYSLI